MEDEDDAVLLIAQSVSESVVRQDVPADVLEEIVVVAQRDACATAIAREREEELVAGEVKYLRCAIVETLRTQFKQASAQAAWECPAAAGRGGRARGGSGGW